MGRRLKFKMGSFYRKDDRSGFVQRAEDTKLEWNGLLVDRSLWEARQPQDFVKGVKDNQTVPNARPLPPNQFVGPLYVQLSADAAIGATSVQVQSIQGMSNGDKVGVMTNAGQFFNTTINGQPSGTNIPLAAALPYPASSGNMLVNTTPEPTIFGPGGEQP